MAVVAWQVRLRIVNHLLAKASPQFQSSVGQVEWSDGGIELRDITVRATDGGTPLLELPRLHVKPFGSGKNTLGIISLEHPKLRLDEKFWQQPATQNAAAAASSSPTTISLEGLEIKDAEVTMKLSTGEEIAVQMDWHGGAMGMDATGALTAEQQVVTIQQLRTTLPGGSTILSKAAMSAAFSLQEEGRTLTIHELHTGPMAVELTQAFLDGLKTRSSSVVIDALPTKSKPMLDRVVVENATVGPVLCSLPQIPGWPQLPRLQASLFGKIEQLTTSLEGSPSAGKMDLQLSDLILGQTGQAAWITLPHARLQASAEGAGAWEVSSLEVPPTPFQLTSAQTKALGLPLPISVEGSLSVQAGKLLWKQDGVISTDEQTVELNDVKLRLGDEGRHEALQWDRLQVAGKWEEITQHQRLTKVHWDAPHVQMDGDDLKMLPSGARSPAQENNGPVRLPAWYGWKCDDLRITDGLLSARGLGRGMPDISSQWRVMQQQQHWLLTLDQLTASTPDIPQAPPLLRAVEVSVEVDPVTLWRERRLERLVIRGSKVHLGATLEDAQTQLEEVETKAKVIGALPFDSEALLAPGDWHIGEVTLDNTKIFLHHLVPDVPEVLIPLARKSFRNVPLTVLGLQQSEKKERLEIPFVYVPGTRTGSSVADLDTNFIHFSLAGLMRREIDFVELVNPKIYVGDGLFHYVEKIRNQTPDSVDSALPKTLTEARALLHSLVAVLEGEAPLLPLEPTWKIARIRAVNGKIVTTVKDSPLLEMPPLPFGADSSLLEGKINAQLAVPQGLFRPVPNLNLIIALSEGAIVFNLPTKQKDNNLVQVFKADWLRYQQFRIANVVLQVTYDKNGVYAKFWAKGYEGDLQGAFNLYLDDTLSWDMWLAGTGIETKLLTETLTPAYFKMTGKLDGKLIAQGDKTSLYQATGEFKNQGEGQVKIVALEDVIKSLPDDWSEAQRVWTKKGMEVLRDFSYNVCAAQLRFYGLEGGIHLQLKGPDGERNFDVFSHDRRLSLPETKP